MDASISQFDQKYYEDIWGTVHRHDYTPGLAAELVKQYGPAKVLDIGTGCGSLVVELRKLGADAWGIEISDYALENSCAKGYVIKGSVTDIPFKEGFDVIHSQGMWEYVAEIDIQRAWLECNRVGKIQAHNIDYAESGLGEERFITAKSKEWWDGKLQLPKILVACPNHEIKEYAFQAWIDNVKSLTYPNIDILVVDNSPSSSFVDRYKNQVPMKHIDTMGIEDLMVLRLNLSYEEIRKEFFAGGYERLMIIESDIIPPKDVIERMLKLGGTTDWISHAYPTRGEKVDQEQGIGCSMFTRKLMETFNFKDFGDNHSSDGGLWNLVRPDGRFTTMELWNYWKNIHLRDNG